MATPTRDAIRVAFEIFDASNTGALELEDVELALKALGFKFNKIQTHDAIMSACNVDEVDNNTRVSYPEFEKLVQEKFQAQAGPRPEAQRAFNLFSEDKTAISADDMVEVARVLGEDVNVVRPKLEHFVDVASAGGKGINVTQWMQIMNVKQVTEVAEPEVEVEEY